MSRVVSRIRHAGLETEFAAAEEAAGLVIEVGYALGRLGIIGQGLPITAAASRCRTAAGHGLVAFHVGRGFGQALGRWSGGLILHLANSLFKHRQGLLLDLVSLLELEKFLFQGLDVRIRGRLQHGRREQRA